jgi:hypothetical protein
LSGVLRHEADRPDWVPLDPPGAWETNRPSVG